MKTHAIIPIFLPHSGCPHDCIFCNQKKITAKLLPMDQAAARAIVEKSLPTIMGRGIEMVEIAFFGGSFTGMPVAEQIPYLAMAKAYKDQGLVHKIRLSTRPDYISPEILDLLKSYAVDIIELGVQSFDDEVLRLSNRGHDSASVYRSSALIKDFGFELGLQLMIGLPGDTYEKALASAQKAVDIGPAIARLYPTIIIRDTGLEALYQSGAYLPLSLDEAVRTAKAMFLILEAAGIKVIRIGLKSSDNIADGKAILGDTFHPAFRQLVDSEVAKESMENQLIALLATSPLSDHAAVTFCSCKASFSNLIGHQKSNKDYFTKAYPQIVFSYRIDNSLPDHVYTTKGSLIKSKL